MINHQNFSTAYPIGNKDSLGELGKISILSKKDTLSNTTNPHNEEWKNRLCENTNQAGINIGIPFICDPANSIEQNGNNNEKDGNNKDQNGNNKEQNGNNNEKDGNNKEQNGNNNEKDGNNKEQNGNNNQLDQDISDRVHDKIGNLKEQIDDSIFGTNESSNSRPNNVQSNFENDDKNGKDSNNDSNDNNNKNDDDGNNEQNSEQQLSDEQGAGNTNNEFNDDTNGNNNQRNTNDGNNAINGNNQGNNNNGDGLGIAGLDLGLNIDKKLGKVNEKINNLKDNLGLGQQENKDNQKNNNDQGNNDDTLGITGLPPNIQNIQANLEKKIEKLKDKFENEQDNQRLIDQRNEFDNDHDDAKDNDDDGDDSNGKDYDGYGFKGDDDNGNGNGHEDREENFNFAAVGDFGCSTNTQNTIENMQSKNPEIVLTLGDLSYHSTADCWFDMMSPVKDKLMLTLGYHDVEDGQAKMNQYMNSFALEKPFYSYDYNKVHFLVMSAKSVYNKGSEQYNFVVDDLKKASENEDVNWIVVSSYGPPYTSPSEHTAFKELREVYHPIFEKYGVDLVLGGHNHNYQRTYPLTYNPNDSGEPKITSIGTGAYDSQKDGIVFAIVGTGGVNLYPFTGQAPFVEKQFDNKFGYLNIDISNGNPHSKLTGTFYDNKGGQILDQFTIDKDLNSKNSEVVSS